MKLPYIKNLLKSIISKENMDLKYWKENKNKSLDQALKNIENGEKRLLELNKAMEIVLIEDNNINDD